MYSNDGDGCFQFNAKILSANTQKPLKIQPVTVEIYESAKNIHVEHFQRIATCYVIKQA